MNDLNQLLQEANEKVKRLSFAEASEVIATEKIIIIDVREESEVLAGRIKNSIHIPRGLLEFSFELGSPNNPGNANADTNLVFYCAGGYRAALAAETMYKMGFKNVFNAGGFNEWVERNGEVS